jgi:ubiquinol-cytochrome c reductase cytochrome b subunit
MRGVSLLRETSAAASLLLFLALATSGWGLMASYVPSSAEAFDAVLYLRRQGGLGGFLRALHHHASIALVVSGFLYLLASFLEGRLFVERRAWWGAVALFGLVLAFCFTGFLLPMDQNAYWGTLVRLGIIETAPVMGPHVAEILRGGGELNASTLPRFYALHVSFLPVLVFLTALLLVGEAREAFADPDRRLRALTAASVVLLLMFGLALALPAPLEPRARPADTAYVPRPEWYFLWLFQLGKYVEGLEWIRSFVVPALGAGLAAALPFLPTGTLRQRGGAAFLLALFLGGFTALSRYEDRALPRKPSYEEGLVARAQEVFTTECRDCHGAEGKGDGPQARSFGLETPDFTDPDFWSDAPISRLRQSVREGRGDDMPAFGKRLTDEEIDTVLAFVQRRFRPATVATDPTTPGGPSTP